MKVTIEEVRGLMRGLYTPADMADNETHDEYLTRKLSALQAECDALAAGAAALYAIHDKCVFVTDDDYESCPKRVQEIIRNLAVVQIPATDAWLNSVRAEGVEMLAAKHQRIVDTLNGDSLFADGERRHASIAAAAVRFAVQLRAGKEGN